MPSPELHNKQLVYEVLLENRLLEILSDRLTEMGEIKASKYLQGFADAYKKAKLEQLIEGEKL